MSVNQIIGDTNKKYETTLHVTNEINRALGHLYAHIG